MAINEKGLLEAGFSKSDFLAPPIRLLVGLNWLLALVMLDFLKGKGDKHDP